MTKKIILKISASFLLLSVIINPYIIGLCTNSDKYCIFGSLAHYIGKPFFYLSLSLLLLSLLVLVVRDEVFQTWIKFVYIWIPLSIISIFISPEYGNSLLPIEKDTVSIFFSSLFLVISLLVIFWKSISLRKKQL